MESLQGELPTPVYPDGSRNAQYEEELEAFRTKYPERAEELKIGKGELFYSEQNPYQGDNRFIYKNVNDIAQDDEQFDEDTFFPGQMFSAASLEDRNAAIERDKAIESGYGTTPYTALGDTTQLWKIDEMLEKEQAMAKESARNIIMHFIRSAFHTWDEVDPDKLTSYYGIRIDGLDITDKKAKPHFPRHLTMNNGTMMDDGSPAWYIPEKAINRLINSVKFSPKMLAHRARYKSVIGTCDKYNGVAGPSTTVEYANPHNKVCASEEHGRDGPYFNQNGEPDMRRRRRIPTAKEEATGTLFSDDDDNGGALERFYNKSYVKKFRKANPKFDVVDPNERRNDYLRKTAQGADTWTIRALDFFSNVLPIKGTVGGVGASAGQNSHENA